MTRPSRTLHACPECGVHGYAEVGDASVTCPSCDRKHPSTTCANPLRCKLAGAAIAVGAGLGACGGATNAYGGSLPYADSAADSDGSYDVDPSADMDASSDEISDIDSTNVDTAALSDGVTASQDTADAKAP